MLFFLGREVLRSKHGQSHQMLLFSLQLPDFLHLLGCDSEFYVILLEEILSVSNVATDTLEGVSKTVLIGWFVVFALIEVFGVEDLVFNLFCFCSALGGSHIKPSFFKIINNNNT